MLDRLLIFYINNISKYYPNTKINNYVIMSNHIHIIIVTEFSYATCVKKLAIILSALTKNHSHVLYIKFMII